MINKDGGGGQFLDFIRGDIELMGVPPVPPPPLAKTLKDVKTRTKSHYS